MASRKPASATFTLDFASLEVSRLSGRGFQKTYYINDLRLQKAWDVALGAAKGIPMNAFMLWMAGSGVQIFSIMITAMMLCRTSTQVGRIAEPFAAFLKSSELLREVEISTADGFGKRVTEETAALTSSRSVFFCFLFRPAFEKFEVTGPAKKHYSLLMPKLAFVAVQMLMLSFGVYKCSSMGLLPTATSDWLAFLEPKTVLEYSATT
ncbi:MAG: hypothetical protein BJ554DRAFT_6358 [Olpidium bornovanus]|uniref:ER membrane protein complex subunit 4 n=1 Tax=Olpidium bornovanus TaxID=278681 RepID=A0A8H8A2L5_9FUNG|nr:MAG: hypothetical protein BJ554DRAFT_6358 [Olpidium bornovanus]